MTTNGPAKFPQQYAVLDVVRILVRNPNTTIHTLTQGREISHTYKIRALAKERCVYPAILDEIVVKDTVKPTDCELVSQKHTRRPHVLDRGR